jgi:hypothetical protein
VVVLVPCLVTLRDEFTLVAPKRDKSSDGWIGNQIHAVSISDHNDDEQGHTPYVDADKIHEVHAIDVDKDLREPGISMADAVSIIIKNHYLGRDNRLQNVIFNRRIWSRSWGWTEQSYTGSSAHTEHAHFSARYTTAQERDTRQWGLMKAMVQQAYFPMHDLPAGARVPLLEFGMDDRDYNGYNVIDRVQKLLNVTDDGIYGPETRDAVKRRYGGNGMRISANQYADLMGISGVS